MVDTYVSGAYRAICVGSSPISDTIKREVKTSLFYYKLKKYAQSKNGFEQYLHDLLMCSQKVIADRYKTSVSNLYSILKNIT